MNEIDPGNYSANDFNLATFYKSEAKLLHNHGHSDVTVPPGIGLYFGDQIDETVAKQGIDVDDFSRLFLTPGMQKVM